MNKAGLQHHAQDSLPADPALVKLNLSARMGTTGVEQFPHTILAELMQLDTLYWPIEQVEQLVHANPVFMPNPVEYVPDWQVLHNPCRVYPSPVPYVPAPHAVQRPELVNPRPVPYVPAKHPEQALAPVSENVPITQDWQVDTLVWPVPEEYMPAAQELQFCVPSPRQPP
jgi:hypothetical protein